MILSLDASTKSTGYAIFDEDKLITYGCISASSQDNIKRINKMKEEIAKLLTEYSNITTVVIEEVRPDMGQTIPQTMKVLFWLQAAIAFLIHDEFTTVKLIFTYPSEWRSKCNIATGRGIKREQLKQEDIKFVKNKFNIDVNDDIADAIGIGYAYYVSTNKELNWE